MSDLDRRTFLTLTGATGVSSLAGCASLLENEPQNNGSTDDGTVTDDHNENRSDEYNDNQDDTDEYNENGNGNEEEIDPEYSLELSLDKNEIDLTNLPTGDLENFSEIRDEDYIDLEYSVTEYLEDEENPVKPDNVTLEIRYENGGKVEKQVEDEFYQLACTELGTGNNTITLKTQINGETRTQTENIRKKTPGTHNGQIIINGETVGNYQSPYTFDNVSFTNEEYHELRQQHILNETWEDIVQPTLEEDEVNFHPDVQPSNIWRSYSHEGENWNTPDFQNMGLNDLEDIINDAGLAFTMHYSHRHGGRRGISGDMNHNAATTITLIDQHINNIPEGENRYNHEREIDLEGGHFSSIGHGNALFYEKNTQQWINYDPNGGTISQPANAPDNKRDDRFYAPTEYMTGNPDNHNGVTTYHRKKEEGIRALSAPHRLDDTMPRTSDIQDQWIHQNVSKIGDNQPLGQKTENMLKALNYTHKTNENTFPIIYGADTQENRLLITDNRNHFRRFRIDSEPVTTQHVQNTILE